MQHPIDVECTNCGFKLGVLDKGVLTFRHRDDEVQGESPGTMRIHCRRCDSMIRVCFDKAECKTEIFE